LYIENSKQQQFGLLHYIFKAMIITKNIFISMNRTVFIR